MASGRDSEKDAEKRDGNKRYEREEGGREKMNYDHGAGEKGR